MSTNEKARPWLQPALRLVVVGVLAGGVVLGAARLGSVAPQATPAGQPGGERVAATTTTGYCPGDPFSQQEDAPKADLTGSVDAHAAPTETLEGLVTSSEEPGRITLSALSQGRAQSPEAPPESGPASETRKDLSEPVVARGTEERAPGLLAGQSFVADSKEVAGLAATPCTSPTADAWLVAGGGEKGRQERLVLANPGGNAVTVQVDVLGSAGEGESVLVPARGSRVLLLDAVGGTDAPQAVHVTTTGGLVVPTIVDHHRDGLTPAGVEGSPPTAGPATRQVIPANANGAERGMVLGAPGENEAVVEIRRVGEDGSRSAKVATVPAGDVVDVDLPAAEGVHSWVVESDEPVVAAAHLSTEASGGERDLAWSVATPGFGSLGGTALPSAPAREVRRFLDITADGAAAEVEVFVQRDGEVTTEEVSLTKDHGQALSIGDAEAVWLRPSSGSVHAAVLLVGREGASRAQTTSVPVLPARVAVRDVDIDRER